MKILNKIIKVSMCGVLLASCEKPGQIETPTSDTVYVVDRNNPETTPAQKTMNNMLDILGVFPAVLKKSGVDTVKQAGVITSASYFKTRSETTHNLTLNEEITNNTKVVYDVVLECVFGTTKHYQRETFETTPEGLKKTVYMPVGLAPGEPPGANTEWKVAEIGDLWEEDGKVYERNSYGNITAIYHKDTKNSIKVIAKYGTFLCNLENIKINLR